MTTELQLVTTNRTAAFVLNHDILSLLCKGRGSIENANGQGLNNAFLWHVL